MNIGSIILAVAMLSPLAAHAANPQPVAAQGALALAQQQVKSADYRLVGRLVRVDEHGARTTESVTIKARWFPGVLRVLFQVSSPASARENVLLEMRPGEKNTILIAHPGDAHPAPLPFDQWSSGPLGGEFSYEDFLEATYFWASQSSLGQTKLGARTCDLLRSAPGPSDQSHYAEAKSWLDHASGFPLYVEKTLKASGTIKQFTYFGLRRTGGVWSATQVEAKIRGRTDSTLLVVQRGSPNAHLGPNDFSTAQLIHF